MVPLSFVLLSFGLVSMPLSSSISLHVSSFLWHRMCAWHQKFARLVRVLVGERKQPGLTGGIGYLLELECGI